VGFWRDLFAPGVNHEGITPNANQPAPAPGTVGETEWTPGDPDGLEFVGDELDVRSGGLPALAPSPWSGWPASWSTPGWNQGGRASALVDTAWNAIDLNASVLSTMPVYRTQEGRIVEPKAWMSSPDPLTYNSWQEFAKQLFWDFQMGEAFVYAVSRYAESGYPRTFRVIPPWMVQVDYRDGLRTYRIGQSEIDPEDILHIRYQSSTDPAQPRGIGPLDSAGPRLVTIGVLQRYTQRLSETGGIPLYWLSSDQKLTSGEVKEMQRDFVETRQRNLGEPNVFGKGATMGQAQGMSAKDMSLLEISQWNESRLANLIGVPPFLLGLPSGGDSMTYSNVSQLFDFHDRASLRTKSGAVMPALSRWLLPQGQAIELNRDEYSRPGLFERAQSYEKLIAAGVMTPEEARRMERLDGAVSASELTGGGDRA
jgi:HK97 family phage portal protein